MAVSDAEIWSRFFAFYEGLERWGPGSRESTARALSGFQASDSLRILELGCGRGANTLDLAELLLHAQITATDRHAPALAALDRAAASAGVGDRIETRCVDMRELDFEPGSFDLVWSEGALYFLGLERALAELAPLLVAGGALGFTEPAWTTASRTPEVEAIWSEEYPPMTDRDGTLARVRAAGWRVDADFFLPRTDWAAYYEPMARRVAELEMPWHGSEAGQTVLANCRQEVQDWRDHGDLYGYLFIVARPG